jgi:hypothetical protein
VAPNSIQNHPESTLRTVVRTLKDPAQTFAETGQNHGRGH